MKEDAFEALYRCHARKLLGFAYGYLRSRAEAEEVLHEVFLALWEGKCGEDCANVRAWLYTVTRNQALKRVRARKPHWEETREVDSPEKLLVDKKSQEAWAASGRDLPEFLREVYALRTQGRSYEEMAEELKLPIGTVKSRMHALVVFLKERMKPWTVN